MSTGRKFPAQAPGRQQTPGQRPGQPHKPGVLQPKAAVASPATRQPAGRPSCPPPAPPVYRPQPVPRVLQAKMPAAPPAGNVSRPTPTAPPVYRPQPQPKVLQTKPAGIQRPPALRPSAPPAASAPHRPAPKQIVQTKPAAGAPPSKVPAATPSRPPAVPPPRNASGALQAKAYGPLARPRGQVIQAIKLDPNVRDALVDAIAAKKVTFEDACDPEQMKCKLGNDTYEADEDDLAIIGFATGVGRWKWDTNYIPDPETSKISPQGTPYMIGAMKEVDFSQHEQETFFCYEAVIHAARRARLLPPTAFKKLYDAAVFKTRNDKMCKESGGLWALLGLGSAKQIHLGEAKTIEAGRLVFFGKISPAKAAGHVGISLGGGRCVHCLGKATQESDTAIQTFEEIDKNGNFDGEIRVGMTIREWLQSLAV